MIMKFASQLSSNRHAQPTESRRGARGEGVPGAVDEAEACGREGRVMWRMRGGGGGQLRRRRPCPRAKLKMRHGLCRAKLVCIR